MNERILELLISIGIDLHYTTEYGQVLENFTLRPDAEKFAKLIVLKCIDIVKHTPDQFGSNDRIINNIKEYFGVEPW